MAKGQNAKNEVINKIANAFGEDWIGEYNKKYYVWANDGGDRVQISIALTCPKVMIEAADHDFTPDHDWSQPAPQAAPKAEITEEERENIASLMERLGL